MKTDHSFLPPTQKAERLLQPSGYAYCDIINPQEYASLLNEYQLLKIRYQRRLIYFSSIIFCFLIGLSAVIIIFLKIKTSKDRQLSLYEAKIADLVKTEMILRELIFKRSAAYQKIIQRCTKNLNLEEFTQLLKEIKTNLLSPDDWKEIINEMNFSFNGFIDRLKNQFSRLSDNDLRLCCLLKIPLSHLDISVILQIETNSVKKYKLRLKQKLQLQNSGIDLHYFLKNF